MKRVIFFLFILLTFNFCNSSRNDIFIRQPISESILKLEMNLSAFGVESDNYPSRNVYIDFEHDSSTCTKSYDNPAYKGPIYHFSNSEMKKILELLHNSDLGKLKKEYKVEKTDQPTSTTTIYTTNGKFSFKDYGLVGDNPLQKLYKIIYKF